jgi:starch synthase
MIILKVLFVGGEASPFSKTGGLGDVLGSLPKALVQEGIDARVVVPKHKITKDKFQKEMEFLTSYRVQVAYKEEYAGIETMVYEGVTFYFIDNEYYFGYRDTLYGHYDDGERYGFFNDAVLKMLEAIDFYPDVLHLNDWQTGLIPLMLRQNYAQKKEYQNIKTIFTIHNIAYQGVFSKDLLEYLNVSYENDLEFANSINFLKTGIQTSDFISTVSETYANEILYDYFSFRMNTVLETRKDDLYGIVNGIDYEQFNPKTDQSIELNYGLHNYLKGKAVNKAYLRNFFAMKHTDVPVIGMVSRLTEAKGFDIIKIIIEDLIKQKKLQIVLLGSGDPDIEQYYENLKQTYPDDIGVYIGYNDDMARNIYAGSDLFLMPSRFEPCGLAQLISLKYGTLPVVRKTGGLRDTIISYNKFTGEGNGFGFENFDAGDLLHALHEAIDVYNNKPAWKRLVRRAMQEDFSWKVSALKYIDLYNKLKGVS